MRRLIPARLRSRTRWHQFTINMLIGLAIELLLQMMSSGSLVTTVKNAVQDAAMNVAAYSRMSNTKSSPAITIFDVDEETWRNPAWGGGEPDLAPRPQLSRLIEIARRNNARNIVVDILLESPGTAQDESFVGDIANLQQALKPGQHVLFVRTLRLPDCQLQSASVLAGWTHSAAANGCLDEDAVPTLRASPLDRLIAGSDGKLIAVAPYFLTSGDGVLRDWALWKAACFASEGVGAGTGTWRLLPSVQLAVAGLTGTQADTAATSAAIRSDFGRCRPALKDDAEARSPTIQTISPEQAEHRMAQALARGLSGRYSASEAERHDSAPAEQHALDPSSVIYFRFPAGTGPLASGGNGIQTLSALQLLEGRAPGDLTDQVVVISQSHESARDLHLTPLGRMPGGMVIANSINSLQDPGVIGHPNAAIELLFTLCSIALVAWLFAVVRAEFSLLLAVAFVPVLLLLSYWMLNLGILVGSEVALLGIYLHWIFRTIETSLEASEAHRRHTAAVAAQAAQGEET